MSRSLQDILNDFIEEQGRSIVKKKRTFESYLTDLLKDYPAERTISIHLSQIDALSKMASPATKNLGKGEIARYADELVKRYAVDKKKAKKMIRMWAVALGVQVPNQTVTKASPKQTPKKQTNSSRTTQTSTGNTSNQSKIVNRNIANNLMVFIIMPLFIAGLTSNLFLQLNGDIVFAKASFITSFMILIAIFVSQEPVFVKKTSDILLAVILLVIALFFTWRLFFWIGKLEDFPEKGMEAILANKELKKLKCNTVDRSNSLFYAVRICSKNKWTLLIREKNGKTAIALGPVPDGGWEQAEESMEQHFRLLAGGKGNGIEPVRSGTINGRNADELSEIYSGKERDIGYMIFVDEENPEYEIGTLVKELNLCDAGTQKGPCFLDDGTDYIKEGRTYYFRYGAIVEMEFDDDKGRIEYAPNPDGKRSKAEEMVREIFGDSIEDIKSCTLEKHPAICIDLKTGTRDREEWKRMLQKIRRFFRRAADLGGPNETAGGIGN